MRLVLGNEAFDLSEDEESETLERRIAQACEKGHVIEVGVRVDGGDVSLTVNPSVVPYWYVTGQ